MIPCGSLSTSHSLICDIKEAFLSKGLAAGNVIPNREFLHVKSGDVGLRHHYKQIDLYLSPGSQSVRVSLPGPPYLAIAVSLHLFMGHA